MAIDKKLSSAMQKLALDDRSISFPVLQFCTAIGWFPGVITSVRPDKILPKEFEYKEIKFVGPILKCKTPTLKGQIARSGHFVFSGLTAANIESGTEELRKSITEIPEHPKGFVTSWSFTYQIRLTGYSITKCTALPTAISTNFSVVYFPNGTVLIRSPFAPEQMSAFWPQLTQKIIESIPTKKESSK